MTLRACCPMENELLVSQWRLSATLPFPLACPRPCLSIGLSLCQQALWGFAPPTILPEGPKLQRAAPEKSRRPSGTPPPFPPPPPAAPPPPSPLPFRLALRIARGKDSDQKARRMALVTMLAQDHCSSDILSSMLLSVFAHALQGLLQVHRRHDHGLP